VQLGHPPLVLQLLQQHFPAATGVLERVLCLLVAVEADESEDYVGAVGFAASTEGVLPFELGLFAGRQHFLPHDGALDIDCQFGLWVFFDISNVHVDF
jgi:hypothetical protein